MSLFTSNSRNVTELKLHKTSLLTPSQQKHKNVLPKRAGTDDSEHDKKCLKWQNT